MHEDPTLLLANARSFPPHRGEGEEQTLGLFEKLNPRSFVMAGLVPAISITKALRP
jgi:hypothetical protein